MKTDDKRRPSVPAEVRREILIESGHRCAVCGASSPLELAHIEPWSKCRRHETKNMICLCASCHQRADTEKWGAKTLYAYKREPWNSKHGVEVDTCRRSAIEISLKMNLIEFDAKKERMLRFALAGFLDIPPEGIEILRKEPGSVKVTIELAAENADLLYESFVNRNSDLMKLLTPLPVTSLRKLVEEEHLAKLNELELRDAEISICLGDWYKGGGKESLSNLIELMVVDIFDLANKVVGSGEYVQGDRFGSEDLASAAVFEVFSVNPIPELANRIDFLEFLQGIMVAVAEKLADPVEVSLEDVEEIAKLFSSKRSRLGAASSLVRTGMDGLSESIQLLLQKIRI